MMDSVVQRRKRQCSFMPDEEKQTASDKHV